MGEAFSSATKTKPVDSRVEIKPPQTKINKKIKKIKKFKMEQSDNS